MEIQRPLCVFDLETTGVNVVQDRIVEMCVIKVEPNGTETTKVWRIHPGMPIPPSSTAIHGITDAMVANSPSFKELAHEIAGFMKDCDVAGYNSNRFDIPLLAEEFLRAEVDMDLRAVHAVDVQNIFHKKEQRTLTAALKFYCQEELVNAHNAEADVRATLNVLRAQVERYEDLPNSIKGLAEFSNMHQAADFAGFITFNKEGVEQFSFGKYKNQTVASVLEKDPGYYSWIQNADFPLYTKKILTAIRLRMR
jgi:DNA polymerase-3 subunit epsilon